MGQEGPKKMHPFFERVRQASNQPNVIIPQFVPASDEEQLVSETDQPKSKQSKRKVKTKSRIKQDDATHALSSADDSQDDPSASRSNGDKPRARRSKRRKVVSSNLLPFKPVSVTERAAIESCHPVKTSAAGVQGPIEPLPNGSNGSRLSPPADASPQQPASSRRTSAPDHAVSGEGGMSVSPPSRKVVVLHLNKELLSSPSRASRPLPLPQQPLTDNGERPATPPMPVQRRTLRFNWNGKLLSSPPANVREEPRLELADTKGPNKPTSRRKGARRSGGKQPGTFVVTLRYGQDDASRKNIAQQIENILCGARLSSLAPVSGSHVASTALPSHEDAAAGQQAPLTKPQPPKPLHPFFLPKPAPEPSDVDMVTGQAETPGNTMLPSKAISSQTPASRHTSPVNLISRPTVPKVPSAWPTARSERQRYPESRHAAWPSRGCMHVRGMDVPTTSTGQPLHARSAKGKRASSRVRDDENILSTISRSLQALHPEGVSPLRTPLRRPRQQHWTRLEFEKIVGSRLTTIHPAVLQGRESIMGASSAFEHGTCENALWTAKYAPTSTKEVLQDNDQASVLRDWLARLMVYAVQREARLDAQASKSSDKETKKRKRKKKARAPAGLEGFIASDDSEDEVPQNIETILDALEGSEDELGLPITTVPKRDAPGPPKKSVLVSGPTGCGKTALVYAAAAELGYEVFEVNAGSRRSGKDILERVGDMARNHLVQLERQLTEAAENDEDQAGASSTLAVPEPDLTKQRTLGGFFKTSAPKPKPSQPQSKPSSVQESDTCQSRGATTKQKQSLILLDDVDILFEEDKQFWSGVFALLEHSKRPVVMTCTDESTVPFEDLDLEAVVALTPPSLDTVADYCLTIAAQEGHLLRHGDVESLYLSTGRDLRATITALQFWCQIGVGSEKAGLDWRPDRRLIIGSKEEKRNVARVISDGGYTKGLESHSPSLSVLSGGLEASVILREEYLMQRCLGVMDYEEYKVLSQAQEADSVESMHIDDDSPQMDDCTHLADLRSDLDIFCGQSSEPLHDKLDSSCPDTLQKQRCNYTETFPVIQADLEVEYSSLTTKIGTALSVLLDRSHLNTEDIESQATQNRPVSPAANTATTPLSRNALCALFEPICREDLTMYSSLPGRQSFSFDREISVLAEDVAPYVRSIVRHDEERDRRRKELIREEAESSVKRRTTRSSRAAADGDANLSRREYYLTRHNDLVPTISETAGASWEEALEEYMRKLPPVVEVPIYQRRWRWKHTTPETYPEEI